MTFILFRVRMLCDLSIVYVVYLSCNYDRGFEFECIGLPGCNIYFASLWWRHWSRWNTAVTGSLWLCNNVQSLRCNLLFECKYWIYFFLNQDTRMGWGQTHGWQERQSPKICCVLDHSGVDVLNVIVQAKFLLPPRQNVTQWQWSWEQSSKVLWRVVDYTKHLMIFSGAHIIHHWPT